MKLASDVWSNLHKAKACANLRHMDTAQTQPRISDLFARLSAGSVERRKSFDLQVRRAALKTLAKVLTDHRADICAAVAADLGKPAVEAELVELLPILSEISHTRRHLRRWMRPRRAWPTLLMLGTSAAVHPEPKGVVLVIAPWNFPVTLAIAPLVSAIAAGNAVMVKPSEMTPATSALIDRLLPLAFPPDLVAVVEGGPEASTALLDLPFDHVFFTGSPAVGKIVMTAAAKNLTPVTLELGGKSPVVLGPGADLEEAAKWIVWAKGVNAGQICVSPDHLYVHESQIEPLQVAIKARFAATYGADAGASTDLPHIVSDRHFARLTSLVEDATDKGASVQALGRDDPVRKVMAPRLLTGTTVDMRISSEEIFGPLLPILPYTELEQVISAINAGPKPLTLYVFSKDNALVDRIRHETSSGSMGVNLTIMPFIHSNLPFGGIGNSGMGSAHGRAGFDTFSHLKSVMRNRFTLMPLLFPPYGKRARRLKDIVMRLVK